MAITVMSAFIGVMSGSGLVLIIDVARLERKTARLWVDIYRMDSEVAELHRNRP